METEMVFRILLPVLIVAFIAHRGYYTRQRGQAESEVLKKREDSMESMLAGVLGLAGLLATIVYILSPDFMTVFALPLPTWVRWAGVGVALAGFGLLQWAQNTLGKSWSDTPRMMKEQKLITSGPYRWIRHPIYTAFLLILGSTLLISSNWMIGLAWGGMTLLETISRIAFEESLMIEYFGDQYREYMQRTGRLFPKVG